MANKLKAIEVKEFKENKENKCWFIPDPYSFDKENDQRKSRKNKWRGVRKPLDDESTEDL